MFNYTCFFIIETASFYIATPWSTGTHRGTRTNPCCGSQLLRPAVTVRRSLAPSHIWLGGVPGVSDVIFPPRDCVGVSDATWEVWPGREVGIWFRTPVIIRHCWLQQPRVFFRHLMWVRLQGVHRVSFVRSKAQRKHYLWKSAGRAGDWWAIQVCPGVGASCWNLWTIWQDGWRHKMGMFQGQGLAVTRTRQSGLLPLEYRIMCRHHWSTNNIQKIAAQNQDVLKMWFPELGKHWEIRKHWSLPPEIPSANWILKIDVHLGSSRHVFGKQTHQVDQSRRYPVFRKVCQFTNWKSHPDERPL